MALPWASGPDLGQAAHLETTLREKHGVSIEQAQAAAQLFDTVETVGYDGVQNVISLGQLACTHAPTAGTQIHWQASRGRQCLPFSLEGVSAGSSISSASTQALHVS